MDGHEEIESLVHLCGCRGKPPLNRVFRPALKRVQKELEDIPVTVAQDTDIGVFPNTDRVRREVKIQSLNGDQYPSDIEDTCNYTLSGSFVNSSIGGDAKELSEYLINSYKRINTPNSIEILKGHTVLIEDALEPVQFFEFLCPMGEPQPGYVISNIDVIHALPKLSAENQARTAVCNAVNDCYTVGAHENINIRPIVVFTSNNSVSKPTVFKWFRSSTPTNINILEPSVFEHDGKGWLFGATVTATTQHQLPRFTTQLTPGDEVLIHRPIGGLSAFTAAYDLTGVDDQILRPLTRDHRIVAEVIKSYCPGPDEEFDPDQHLKLVTDVSGPGIRGVLGYLTSTDLLLTDLPLINPDLINRAQERWALPDVTVETNGPLLIIGSSHVIRSFCGKLPDCEGVDPKIVGQLISGSGRLRAADGLDLQKFIETFDKEDQI